jgi:hypothetical protein
MAKPKQKREQQYDGSLKALFGEEAEEMIPYLVPGTQLLTDHNIEIDRTTLKADLVYNILRYGLPHILNMELQTKKNKLIYLRLLQYHVNLHEKYQLPVLSVILYPFEQEVPKPPFQEWSGEDLLMFWRYEVIGLYNLEAERFRSERVYSMYSLLPAMKGATAPLLIQTLHDLRERYPNQKMRHHLDRFWKMLQKSVTITDEDRFRVEEEMKMQFDWFIDTVPQVIERVQQAERRGKELGKVEGKTEGKVEGQLELARQMVLEAVQNRFPTLANFAQTQVASMTQLPRLRKLVFDLTEAPDEIAAIHLLTAKGT